MNLKPVVVLFAALVSSGAIACGDPAFGPDYNADPCPPAAPAERIPLTGWDYPIQLGVDKAGNPLGEATVQVQVVFTDFVMMVASLPGGVKVSGMSNQCVKDLCTYLAHWARADLEYKVDAILRSDYLK